jgi:hypothetical protein
MSSHLSPHRQHIKLHNEISYGLLLCFSQFSSSSLCSFVSAESDEAVELRVELIILTDTVRLTHMKAAVFAIDTPQKRLKMCLKSFHEYSIMKIQSRL